MERGRCKFQMAHPSQNCPYYCRGARPSGTPRILLLMQRLSILLVAAFLISGCDKVDQQREVLDTADKRVKAGAYRDAIRSYESALDGTAKTADVHYKIAVLY